MAMTTESLRTWLEFKYHEFAVAEKPLHGTYGLIWFLTAKSPKIFPQTFAVKSVSPEKVDLSETANDLTLLRREFRMWLDLPPTYNVMPALGFDNANLSDAENRAISFPVMRMPKMLGALDEWVTKPAENHLADRLIALSQALNGLQYLYENGFQGHGDLKPSNLLYEDLKGRFRLDDGETWPSNNHPWCIRVADIGWADAWVDLGFTNKAMRAYMAPERLDGQVIPVKSDMFSMGVIASELLQGHHPAENLRKVLASEGKWMRWVQNGNRMLTDIHSGRVKRIVERCLNPDPSQRPDAKECMGEICDELKETHRIDIAATLAEWRKPSFIATTATLNEHHAWAAVNSIRLGPSESMKSRNQILKRLEQIKVVDFETCEAWVPLADSLIKLADTGNGDVLIGASHIQEIAADYFISILGAFDDAKMCLVPKREDWPKAITNFERFASTIKNMADVAGIAPEEDSGLLKIISPYARSALFFGAASDLRFQRAGEIAAVDMLSKAIEEAPNEPVNYYFRALWSHNLQIIQPMVSKSKPLALSISERIEADLHKAISLAPGWKDPIKLLEEIRKDNAEPNV